MKKYASLIVFIAVFAEAVFLQASLQRIDRITCPKQEEFNVYNPTRVGQNKIRYWFGGKFLQWTPMSIDSNEAGPYTQVGERSAPQIEALRINLAKNASNGDWTVSCTYGTEGLYSATEGTTSLTVRAKTCTLNTATSTVSCN